MTQTADGVIDMIVDYWISQFDGLTIIELLCDYYCVTHYGWPIVIDDSIIDTGQYCVIDDDLLLLIVDIVIIVCYYWYYYCYYCYDDIVEDNDITWTINYYCYWYYYGITMISSYWNDYWIIVIL